MQTFVEAIREAINLLGRLDPVVMEIVGRTLQVTLIALLLSSNFSIPIGAWLALARFPGG